MSEPVVNRAAMTALGVLSSVAAIAALCSAASAQPGHHGGMPGGGGAVPHVAAPAAPHIAAPAAPHMAAPAAPHIAAPHVAAPAAPHFAAPAPHAVAPHVSAAPHFAAPVPHAAPPRVSAAPHFAAPHVSAAPHVTAPHIAAPRNFAGSHVAGTHGGVSHIPSAHAPQVQRFSGTSRHAIETRTRHELQGHAATPPQVGSPAAVNERTGRFENRREPALPGAREGQTVGVNRPNAGARETGQLRREQGQEQGRLSPDRMTPIIRNPVFASQSPRAMGASPSQWTFRGRFVDSALGREYHHRHAAVVLGFVGGLFWPYAYDDFIDYTFAPYAYDTFWPYAFDDVYADIYGGYAPAYYAPEDAYAYAGSPASERAYMRASRETGNTVASGGRARICNGQAQGLTDFSIEKIVDQVHPDERQQALLDDLKAATLKAVDILQAACPAELPSTPTGRLAAMRARVDAMLRAVQTVRPALENFYQSLNDEQRERFNALDQVQQAQAGGPDRNGICNAGERAQSRVPVDRIERALHLNRDQEDGLRALNEATLNAADMMKAQCQPTQNLTPTGRLAAIEDRLAAVNKALEITQSALDRFYSSLSDEQKARFDRINVRSG